MKKQLIRAKVLRKRKAALRAKAERKLKKKLAKLEREESRKSCGESPCIYKVVEEPYLHPDIRKLLPNRQEK